MSLVAADRTAWAQSESDFFRAKIEPILTNKCLECHGADPKGNLDLRTSASFLRGGKHGSVFAAGMPETSRLYRYVSQNKMPPNAPLTKEEIADLRVWIERGAFFPNRELVSQVPAKSKRAGLDWWSLQPIRKPPVPASDPAIELEPMDAFLNERLRKEGLSFSKPADSATFLRRATLTLTGMPATFEEIKSFTSDKSPTAKEAAVDRLLASTQYGERWARHWLDLVRFAESDGFERDRIRPNAWRYRDYVIASFNRNLPFDQFVRQQLAGDSIDDKDPAMITAMGFLAAGPRNDVTTFSPLEKQKTRQDELDDFASVTAATFLGMTVGCARCHDHKYDPISTKDYYSFTAFFSGLERADRPVADAQQRKVYQDAANRVQQQITGADAEIKKTIAIARKRLNANDKSKMSDEAVVAVLNEEERKLFSDAVAQRARGTSERARLPKLPMTFTVVSGGTQNVHVLRRGEVRDPGELVSVTSLSAIPSIKITPPDAKSDRGMLRRKLLADWIANSANPLTARVFVNRVWQAHFGTGIVDSPSDFGFQGEKPSNAELLDWLAADFIQNGWNIKRLHKMIVLSRAFGQSSSDNRIAWEKDPANRWLWRFSPSRLDAESIRDAILKCSGQLNAKMGGPSVAVFNYRDGNVPEYLPLEELGKETFRRSVYLFNIRTFREPLLSAYDCPEPTAPTPKRNRTTSVQQALTLLNSRFVANQCYAAADQIRLEGSLGPNAQVQASYRKILSREPTPAESKEAIRFMGQHGLPALVRVLLNSNEFVYIP